MTYLIREKNELDWLRWDVEFMRRGLRIVGDLEVHGLLETV